MAAADRRWFYWVSVGLLLAANAAALVEKRQESATAASIAKQTETGARETGVSQAQLDALITSAKHWQTLSLALALVAVACWIAAVWRREKPCGSCLVTLLLVYVGLQLLLV